MIKNGPALPKLIKIMLTVRRLALALGKEGLLFFFPSVNKMRLRDGVEIK